MNNIFKLELFALIFVVLIFWYFNIRPQDVLVLDVSRETMKNISVFDGNNI